MDNKIVLASASPRRAELLRQVGLEFEVMVSEVEETLTPGLEPAAQVELFALRKANAVAATLDRGIVIGADTVVVQGGRVLGKPVDAQEAVEMLQLLQGKGHEVYTGVALVDARSSVKLVEHVMTRVFFNAMSEESIRRYVATGEPLDKAGAYAVQGRAALFINRLEGCYYNVVGLPLARLATMLKKLECEII
ncbi:MAG: septum formation inhibitor Maf [Peptococcaceae bacterium]|mgnify:CR=1 FL=1|nr:septum formation inhibitor Maf [Peptococcaceae bacterium]